MSLKGRNRTLEEVFTLPNAVTFFRLILTFLLPFLARKAGTLLVGLLASIIFATDFLDGYLARKYSLTTKLGKVLDPLADRLAVLSVSLSLVFLQKMPLIIFELLVIREAVAVLGYLILKNFFKIDVGVIPEGKVIAAAVYIILIILSLFKPFYLFFWAAIILYYCSLLFYLKSIVDSFNLKGGETR